MKVLIPMAGAGSRFAQSGYDLPKPLIVVNNMTLIEHSIRSFDVDAHFVFVTRQWHNPEWNAQLSQLLKQLRPESTEIQISHLTNGASETCLAAADVINNNQPLVIYNCDQIIRWDPQEFLRFVQTKQPHGAVVLYNSTDAKNSFAQIQDGQITKLVEKQAVSNHALIGFHYWAQGCDFVTSARLLVDTFHVSGQPECYVSETYNYLIAQGRTILPYHISNNKFVPLGTPQDVARYLGQIKEYHTHKPMTIFCDIDGTILKHAHTISSALAEPAQLLPGVREKFDQWDSVGHRIVLTTARKESTRAQTEHELTQLGIAWDQLIMGVTSGTRVLINDKLRVEDADRAVAINVETDGNWNNINWGNHQL